MEIKDFIKVYDNTLNLETVSKIIKFAKNCKYKQVGLGENNEVETKLRNAVSCQLTRTNESLSNIHWANFLANHFKNIMEHYTNSLNPLSQLKDYPVTKILTMEILKYEQAGHYVWHTDAGSTPDLFRTFSLILILNNDYEGGVLQFRNPDGSGEMSIDKVPGRIILWPSNFMFPHRVIPVTKGIRYSIVSWFG
jgi:hypothetical protein